MKLTQFKVLSFDCYGTLIDWETGLLDSLAPLTDRLSCDISKAEILQTYAHYESFQQKHTPTKPYSEIMATVYKRIAEQWETPVSWNECLLFGESLKLWPAFPDSADALAYLKDHYKLAILSNVDNEGFAASNERLGVTFDAIYTAQDIGSYKPDNNNFRYMIESLQRFRIDRADILHTAQSLYHDHEPANRHQLNSCWIDRQHSREDTGATSRPTEMPRFNFRYRSMKELVEAHTAVLNS